MESLIRGLFKVRWQPQLQFVRCNTKVNVTQPRPPHFERAIVENLCLPYFDIKKKPRHIPDFEACVGQKRLQSQFDENYPLVVIKAKEYFNYFQNSKLIGFFHVNSLNSTEKFEVQLLSKKNGMKLLFLSKHVLKKSLTGTPFECVLPLYQAPTATAFCSELNIKNLLKVFMKSQKLILMGAIIENKFLSFSELKAYENITSITDARLHLVTLLNSASQNLVQQINYHPCNLTALLNHHKKVLEDGNVVKEKI